MHSARTLCLTWTLFGKHTLEGLAATKICPCLTLQLKEGKEKSKQNPQHIFPQSYLSSCWSRARNTPVGTSGLRESPGQWGPQGCCSLTCPVLGLCQQGKGGPGAGHQRYTPLSWALRDELGDTRSGFAELLCLRKNKEAGKQPGGDAACPAVFTSPSPTLEWPIVEIACSLAGLGRAPGQRGFTGPLPANPAAKNWASYLTLQRQHPFPSQGVITNTCVGRGEKASVCCQGYTLAANTTGEGSSDDFLGGSEELQAVQATGRDTCLYLPANFLAEIKVLTLFLCDATVTVCPS